MRIHFFNFILKIDNDGIGLVLFENASNPKTTDQPNLGIDLVGHSTLNSSFCTKFWPGTHLF